MGFSIKKPVISAPKGITSALTTPISNPASFKVNTNINPFGGNSGGGTLGNFDVIGNTLDKANPYVKKDQAKQAAAAATAAGGGSVGEVESLIKKYLPEYKSPLDKQGNLPDQLKAIAEGVQAGTISAPPALAAALANASTYNAATTNVAGPDQTALNAIKARAMATGDSPWATLQKQQNELARIDQMDQAGGSALGAADLARSQLAMKGGLQSGAAERIAESSARDLNANRAGIGRAAQANALGIGISDDQTKMALLSQIPGMDLANAGFNLNQAQFNTGATNKANEFNANANNATSQFNANATNQIGEFNSGQALDVTKANAANALNASEFNSNANNAANQFNIGNTLAGMQGQNAFNAYTYGQQMQGYGAAKSSDAVANSGKK